MSAPDGSLPAPAAPYAGDAALDRLLDRAGSPYRVAQLRDLVAGTLAAPEPLDPAAWVGLVVAAPGPELTAQLLAFRAAIRPAPAAETGPAARLAALRAELARRGLAGFILPRGDEHQGEYVAPRSERLSWLTGFTGSAGMAVVLADKAAVFIDGRYTLQVRTQVDTTLYETPHLITQPPSEWLAAQARPGDRIGYDPWLHTQDGVKRLRAACERAGASLVPASPDPIDAVWPDQPPPPLAPVHPHPAAFAGESSSDKRARLGAEIAKAGAQAVVLTQPDSIAWLLNIRGGDVPHTPLALSFAILRANGQVDWFIDPRKLLSETRAHLGNDVAVQPPEALGPALDALGAARTPVQVDAASTAGWIFDRLEAASARLVVGADPCALPKACKNPVELANTRSAHLRDGAALTRFLAWVGREAPKGTVREMAAMDRLFAIRAEGQRFRDLSFTTISGSGANGAIVHYRSTPATDRALQPGELYLVDSGAQYLDGTTDVTRTVAVGAPGAEERDRFTRVLKGHIAIATARFPAGTTGSQLDSLARRALWEVGLNFDHGTGHGVGSYLSVHEGPHRISSVPNTVALRPGMIVSNEPGYYKTGAYGIRIENLVAVKAAEGVGDGSFLEFETLTLAPIDRALIEPALLTAAEIAWFDAYHQRVRAALTPLVDAETAAWLIEATAPIGTAQS